MSKKERVDVLLVKRGLVESRALAQRLVMAGAVRVSGDLVAKPSAQVPAEADITVEGGRRYVSRGGEKLAAALAAFPVPVEGRVCVDVGASTGGFTDCLLQAGAARVYAVDVGQGILHWKLRGDPRVVVMEGQNARHLAGLPEPIGLGTVDASFISLRILLPVLVGWMEPDADLVALVKPQFEAGRRLVGRGGVVRKPEIHRQVLTDVLAAAQAADLPPAGLIRSPLIGPKGNVEFLLWCRRGGPEVAHAALIEAAAPAPVEE